MQLSSMFHLFMRLADFIVSDCALTLERTMDLPTIASDKVRYVLSRESPMNVCKHWITRCVASSLVLLAFVWVLTWVFVFFSAPPKEFARFVNTDARDSARSMALRTADEVPLISAGSRSKTNIPIPLFLSIHAYHGSEENKLEHQQHIVYNSSDH